MEDTALRLQDGNKTIFLNTKGENPSEISTSLLHFLKFIKESQPNEIKDYHDPYVTQLQNSIRQIKRDKELGSRFMLLELMLRDEYRKGREEGRAEGIIETVLDILEKMGTIPNELSTFIKTEHNPEHLKFFVPEALKATSISEFMENISFRSSK